MTLRRRTLLAAPGLLGLRPAGAVNRPIRIGVLNDRSGPYADVSGSGSVAAAQLAIDELGGIAAGRRVELLSADHQNKPDIGATIARRWFDTDDVGLIVDVVTSSVALAVQGIAREKDRIVISSGAGTDELAGASCLPNSFVWTWDTYALTHAAVHALADEGHKTWFLLAVDYALGAALERSVRSALVTTNGRVTGVARHPLGTTDFSSYLLQAQASGASVIGLLNGGADAVNAVKQAAEFGITRDGTQQIAAVAMLVNDVKAVGLMDAQGLRTTESFYWDLDDRTRAWSTKFATRNGGAPASMIQAGTYSAVRHYLRAVETTRSTVTKDVTAAMTAAAVDDPTVSPGARIRADGRLMRDFFIFRVKAPKDSIGPWDLYKQISVVPSSEAAVPASESACPLLRPT